MDDDRLDAIMEDWVAQQCGAVPELQPTLEMRGLVTARRPRRGWWFGVGLAAAGLIAALWLVREWLPAGSEPNVATRQLALGRGIEVRGPRLRVPKGSGREKGLSLKLVGQVYAAESQVIIGFDPRAPDAAVVVLAPEDAYRLTLLPSGDAFVRVYQLRGEQDFEQLFPSPENAADTVPAGRVSYLPARPSWFFLREERGEERVIVIASTRPLSSLDDPGGTLLERVEEQRGAGAVVVDFVLTRR